MVIIPASQTQMEHIQDLIVAARDEIEYAKEKAETIYFNESVAEARRVVEECLTAWNSLLARLSEADTREATASYGLEDGAAKGVQRWC
jgi:hypothetical protein